MVGVKEHPDTLYTYVWNCQNNWYLDNKPPKQNKNHQLPNDKQSNMKMAGGYSHSNHHIWPLKFKWKVILEACIMKYFQ